MIFRGSMRLASMSAKLKFGIALQGAFVLFLGYCYIFSLGTPEQLHHEVRRDLFFSSPDSYTENTDSKSSVVAVQSNKLHTSSGKHSSSCKKYITFFGMIPYWKEVVTTLEHRSKRWIRNVLEGSRVQCNTEACSVFVSYTENPEDILSSDVVIFTNTFEWMSNGVWDKLVELRPQGQKWIMSTQESPHYVPGLRPPLKYRNVSYDWSDTYRTDSTFPSPYGKYVPFKNKDNLYLPQHKLEALVKSKEKAVAWVASHCETLQWNRTKFVEDLQKHIPIDTYGKCGTMELPWRRRELLRKVMEPYRFYLSFENSCCSEYITEKFWRSLDLGMIPVVVGAPLEDYLKVAPPNSFLHIDQFNSLKEMADYMIEISQNESKLRRHLAWRTKGEVHTEEIQEHIINPLRNTTLCSIVKRLNANLQDDEKSLFDFFGEQWDGSCRSCSSKQWMRVYQTST